MGAKFAGSAWSDDADQIAEKGAKVKQDKMVDAKQQEANNDNAPAQNKAADDDEKAKETETNKFILKDGSQDRITRFHYDREMVIGMWEKSKFSHSSVFICYFSKISNKMTNKDFLTARTFSIELFVKQETNENVLSIKGPMTHTRDYKCNEFYIIHANMNELIDIAKAIMNGHGKYDFFRNNCRHYSHTYLSAVKESCNAISVNISCDVLNQYIYKYGNPSKDDEAIRRKMNRLGMAQIDEDDDFDEMMISNECDEEVIEVETMSFSKVLKQFPLS
mmetsp:Transcript_27297/g.43193  ORF Transcript_27297/g.43193 Transcript_27297/m.43193 type:complete len:277 (+) Transcript_27297:29-859(+)